MLRRPFLRAAPAAGGAPVAAPADAVLQFRVVLPYDRSAPEPVLPASLRRRPYRILTGPPGPAASGCWSPRTSTAARG